MDGVLEDLGLITSECDINTGTVLILILVGLSDFSSVSVQHTNFLQFISSETGVLMRAEGRSWSAGTSAFSAKKHC